MLHQVLTTAPPRATGAGPRPSGNQFNEEERMKIIKEAIGTLLLGAGMYAVFALFMC